VLVRNYTVGEEEPLASHVADTDISLLKKDSLIISTVRALIAQARDFRKLPKIFPRSS